MGKLQEMLDARQAPLCFFKRPSFTPGYDPFLANYPGDKDAIFTSEKEKDIAAARRGALKLTGDQFMEHQDKVRDNSKKAAKERRLKAIREIPKQELVAAIAGAMPHSRGGNTSTANA